MDLAQFTRTLFDKVSLMKTKSKTFVVCILSVILGMFSSLYHFDFYVLSSCYYNNNKRQIFQKVMKLVQRCQDP